MAPIPSIVLAQRDFSAGVVDFDARRRDDTTILKAALQAGTNMRPLSAGGMIDRPGREFQYFTDGRPGWARPSPGVRHKISFGDGTFTARTEDNVSNTTLAGCPWAEADIPNLKWCMADDTIIVAGIGTTMPPQVIYYDVDEDEWTRVEFAFQEELNGDIRQPYYRFAAGGITMQPSALTGSITVTFSDDVLVAGHVGKIFRYFDYEMEFTAVASAVEGTATVTRALPGTRAITVGSTTGFGEGDAVEGATSGTAGVVSEIVSSTVMNVVLEVPGSAFGTTEVIVGPTARSTSSANSAATAAAFPIWDEQLVSDVRGYPEGVNFDRDRVMFYDFPLLGRAVVWSELGVIDAFNVGTLPTDGMFETLPVNCEVKYVDGGADQFVYTDVGVFYIPISSSSPLVPGSVEFRSIPSDGAAAVRPARTMDGAVFINQARNRVLSLRATGQTAQPYIVEDIGEYHRDLFSSPIELALSTGSSGQELVYVLNDDGTMVAGKLNRGENLVGWFPWEGEGLIRYLASDRGDVLFGVEYELDSGSVLVVEEEDEDGLLDCLMDGDDTATLAQFVGLTGAVFENGIYGGQYVIAVDGTLTGWGGTPADATVGFTFDGDIMPFVGNADAGQSQRQRMRMRSIKQVACVVNGTAAELTFCGRVHSAYHANDDEGAAPERRNKTIFGRVAGRSHEPEIRLQRTAPGRLKVIEFSIEVTV